MLTLLTSKCRIYRHAGDFARSIEVGEAALAEIRALGLEGTEDAITLASTLAGSYRSRGDMLSAQRLAARVIEQAERLASRQAQGHAYWGACTIAMARGDLALALDLATKTLALLAESPLPHGLSSMRINYAWLLLRSSPPRLDEADAMLSQAHDVLAELAYAQGLVACETEMAWSALLRRDLDRAAELAEQAAARCTDPNAVVLQNARVVRGLTQVMAGEPDEGAEVAGTAAARLAELGARPEAAQAWRDLADALLQHGRSDLAVSALQRAADCAGLRPSALGVAVPVSS
jgi:tetratricopeptide (TPR) repeat protein